MKKQHHFLWLIVLALAAGTLQAQQAPEFVFTLIISDPAGRTDSVQIGYDPMATLGADTAFGEVDMSGQAFDSLFEVRVLANDDDGPMVFQSKYSIRDTTCHNTIASWEAGRFRLMIRADSFPLKVQWDHNLFNSPSAEGCRDSSILAHHTCNSELGAWDLFPYEPKQLLSEAGVLYLYLEEGSFCTFGEYVTTTDGSLKYARYLPILFSTKQLDVDVPITISTHSPQAFPGQAYPNPAQDWLYLRGAESINSYAIYNANGRPLYSGTFDGEAIPVAQLPQGLYVLHLHERQGRRFVLRFIKA